MITNVARIVNHIRSVRPKWLVLTAFVTVAVLSASFTPLVFASNNKWDSNSRLVTFYDDGVEKTIITKGKDVAAALQDAEITIGDNDKITPSVNSELTDTTTVVNIRRARPVTVVDGDGRRSRVVTAEVDTGTVAKQAGMALQSHDTTELSVIDNFVSAGGVGQELSIARAKTVNLTLYGQQLSLRTQKHTVREMLTEAGIRLDASDTASVDLNSAITDGMSVQIWRNGVQTIEQEEEVTFETQVIEDSTKKVGYEEIQTVGQNGKKSVIYEVNMQNGVEIGRQKISEVVTTPAVMQVVVKGTKVELPPGSHTDWMRAAGIPESDFGAANYIITKESGWNPYAKNPRSSAVGLPQCMASVHAACNTDKWRNDPIEQLRWFHNYCKNRYGSIQGAYNHWVSGAHSY